jgi:hypothetical protein
VSDRYAAGGEQRAGSATHRPRLSFRVPLAASRPLALALLLLLPAQLASAGSVNTTTAIATDNAATCDIGEYTAATLLLPYFEVDYNASSTTAIDTVFSVMNTSRYPQIVRMTIWTDLGFPAA